jgi:hypothetical protein
MLAYIVAAAVYGITEAGFRMLNPIWIFLLLAVVSANGIAAGILCREEPKIPPLRVGTASETPASNELSPQRETIYAARRGFYPI